MCSRIMHFFIIISLTVISILMWDEALIFWELLRYFCIMYLMILYMSKEDIINFQLSHHFSKFN